MTGAHFLRQTRVYSAPTLFVGSILLSVTWRKDDFVVYSVKVRFLSVCLILSSLVLIALHGSRGTWLGKWRKLLPSISLIILPIVGFASLIRESGCDAALRDFLYRPLTSVGLFATVLVTAMTFAVNVSLLSANASAMVVALVALPALASIGVQPQFAAASVLIGTWGAVCSVGSQHANLIAGLTQVNVRQVVTNHKRAALIGLLVACCTLLMEVIIRNGQTVANVSQEHQNSSLIKALLPLLPMVVLLGKPVADRALRALSGLAPPKLPLYTCIGILLCSLIVICVAKLTWLHAARYFLSGVGNGVSSVVMLFAAVLVFADCMEVNGWIDRATDAIRYHPSRVGLLSMSCAATLAILTGTSDAPVAALNSAFLQDVSVVDFGAVEFGSLTWIGGEMGRCLSPWAAVTLYLSKDASCMSIIECSLLPICLAGIAIFVSMHLKRIERG